MTVTIVLLVIAIVGIVAIFAIKNREEKTGSIMFPWLRSHVDAFAIELKRLLEWSRREAERLPPLMLRMTRLAIHDLALGFAALARWLEKQAHNVAELVSHKHRFERRESRNEFLRRVRDHKNGNGTNNAVSGL